MSVQFGGGAGGGGATININVINSGDTISISGNCVCISGQPVSISGNVVITSVSGNLFSTSISGNAVNVSGATVIAKISGQTVYPVSAPVYNYIYDYSGQTWTQAATDTSGSNKLLVAASVNVAANVSGNVVYLANDGTNNVVIAKTSGQVANIAGQAVLTSVSGNVISTSVSGNVVSTSVSGNVVRALISGDYVKISGTVPVSTSVSGNIVGVDPATLSGLPVTASITTNISGQVVYLANDGTNNVVVTSVSGNAVTTSVSGNIVNTSGQVAAISGQAVRNSGQTIYPVSGQSFLYIWDYSGATWTQAATSNSGTNKLLVDAGSISVNANVSGNVVYVASVEGSGITSTRANSKDHLNVWISGQSILTSVSGNVISTSISGNVIAVSGTVTVAGSVTATTSVSGNYVNVASASVAGFSGLAVSVSGNVVQATVNSNVSGNVVYVASIEGSGITSTRANSKDHLNAWISGQSVLTSVSGNVIAISGTATVAGAVTTSVSGNTVLTVPAWYGAVDVSGWYLKVSGGGFSGANVIAEYVFDYSGQQFVARPSTTSGQGIPFVSIASGISAQVSGASVLTSVSGNVVSTSVSGNAVSISGNVVAISGTVTVAGSFSANVSGNVVYVASVEGSGITSTRHNSKDMLNVYISGQSVLTSVSGNVVAISGTATVAGAVTTSVSGNTVLNVPAWYGAVDVSGWFLKVSGPGFSGANTVGNYIFDYSGQQFIAWASTTSGIGIPQVSISGQPVLTSVSGNVISVTGGGVSVSGNVVSISGSVTTITSVSGNVVKPQTPTFINTLETFRISVASGGVQLSSFACISCTVRNIGNSGDVILVGSLSSPPYFGTSGQAFPAISGKGLWLRDGDAITLNTTDTANIKVTANLSGTPISYISIG